MPLLVLLVVFVIVPLAELFVILKVSDELLGPWLTIGLLVADSILGSVLLRWQGRATWRRFIEAVQAGRVPHREILDGVLVIFGGALLITPGFITDVVGVLLLLPPSRAVVRQWLAGFLTRRAVTGFADVAGGARTRPRRESEGDVVEGTAWETGDDGDAAAARRGREGGPAATPRLER